MISHLPLHACDREAEKVLIVGGGDGCVLREVLKHQSVKEVVMVEVRRGEGWSEATAAKNEEDIQEYSALASIAPFCLRPLEHRFVPHPSLAQIDPAIIKVAKKYFGHVLNSAFSDPRLTIVHSDAASYLINSPRTSEYDVIINDSSDPCGPSETLFSPAFFKAMYKSLKPGGVVASQSESMWMNIEFAADMMAANAAIYDGVEYGNIMIPSYPCGGLGMVVGTKAKVDGDVVDVRRMRGGRVGKEDKRGLLYYSGRTHKAAFEVPPFARRELSRAMGGRRGRGRSWEGSFDLYSSEEEEEGQTGQDDKGCVVT